MLIARDLDVPEDPVALARRLVAAGLPHVALLHTAAPEPLAVADTRRSFITAAPDRRSERLDPLADDPGFTGAEGPLAGAPRWIGVIPYEHLRALERPGWAPRDERPPALIEAPIFYRYRAVLALDHEARRAQIIGDDHTAVERLAAALLRPAVPSSHLGLEVIDDEPPSRHAARIIRARELIADGDLYQVNLARRLRVRITQGDALALYASLARRAPASFGAYLELDDAQRVVSTSPELLLRAETSPETALQSKGFRALFTAPIKGTRPRGANAAEDAALIRELDQDPKECAELTMIIDVERHDLGRVAEVGSVRLTRGPEVVTHATLHHRLASLTARAREELPREAILTSMLPSGSVTGAPKARAMEVIAALEPRRRGLYTGGIGFVAHDGSVTLAMAIRTAVLDGIEGEYWTGGGIVADSDPAREVEETHWKALQLARAAAEG